MIESSNPEQFRLRRTNHSSDLVDNASWFPGLPRSLLRHVSKVNNATCTPLKSISSLLKITLIWTTSGHRSTTVSGNYSGLSHKKQLVLGSLVWWRWTINQWPILSPYQAANSSAACLHAAPVSRNTPQAIEKVIHTTHTFGPLLVAHKVTQL